MLALAAAVVLAAATTPTVTPADWLEKPDAQSIFWAYPPEAAAADVSGSVLLNCDLAASGMPEQCVVLNETPPGYGFGEAAVSMSRIFRFSPRLVNGVAVRSQIKLPIRFELPPRDEGEAAVAAPSMELARRLVAALAMDREIDQLIEERAWSVLAPAGPPASLPPEERRVKYEVVREEVAIVKPKLLATLARTYAVSMTPEELRAAVAFLEAPVGAKVVADIRGANAVASGELYGLRSQFERDLKDRYCVRTPGCAAGGR